MIPCRARRVLATPLLLLVACGSPATPAPTDDADTVVDAGAAARLRSADSVFVAAFPDRAAACACLDALAATRLQPTASEATYSGQAASRP